MPVLLVSCPDCGKVSKTLVLDGCRMPEEWICGACGGRRGRPDPLQAESHPWEISAGSGCLCCGPTAAAPHRCSAVEG